MGHIVALHYGLFRHPLLKDMKFKDHKNTLITREIFELIYLCKEYCVEGKCNPVFLQRSKYVRDEINVRKKISHDEFMSDKLEDLVRGI